MSGEEDPGAVPTLCESWNGTNWTEVNDINTGRKGAAATGPNNTAALLFGARAPVSPTGITEEWNGVSWAEQNDLNTGRYALGGAGYSNTAALGFGGNSGSATGATEEWNVPSNTVKTLTD